MTDQDVSRISAKTIARLTRVHSRTVTTWTKQATFPRPVTSAGRGRMWDASEVLAWWLEHEIAKRMPREVEGEEAPPHDVQREQARLARARAVEKEIQIAERRGDLVPAGAARQALASAVVTAKTALLAVPARCAELRPDLSRDVIELIRKIIRETLEELAQSPMPGEAASKRRAA